MRPTDQEDDPGVDPRVLRSRRRVQRAALEVLAEDGWGAFTIEAVAERSGVARSTIYRHWPDAPRLIADALESLNRQPGQEAGSGDAEGPPGRAGRDTGETTPSIAELLVHLTTASADSVVGRCLPALVEGAHRDPAVARFLHAYTGRRRRALVLAIERGVAAGELPAGTDAEVAAVALSGAVLYRRLMTERPLEPERVDDLVAQVLGRGPR